MMASRTASATLADPQIRSGTVRPPHYPAAASHSTRVFPLPAIFPVKEKL
jgi:hypothetical protein